MNRAIRLIVSSTFSDMKAERDLLQRAVFPKLQRLCLSKRLRFQAIDLRWGVSEEAGKDNRTMRICLRELKRCQEAEIKPNFLVLLGDRYGSPTPPTRIRASSPPACTATARCSSTRLWWMGGRGDWRLKIVDCRSSIEYAKRMECHE